MEVDWRTLAANSWVQFSLLAAAVAFASYLLGYHKPRSRKFILAVILLIPTVAAALTLVIITDRPRQWFNDMFLFVFAWVFHIALLSFFLEGGRRAAETRVPAPVAFMRKL